MSYILEAKNVVKEYGSFNSRFKAVKGISLGVEKGEFLSIMGPSGSGKSTLLNLLATIDRASQGKVLIDGKSVISMTERQLALTRREYISFIFQECNLLDNLTLRDNILSPLVIMGVDIKEANERLASTSKRLNIEELLDKFPSECSGGQRQRAAACRALVTNPKIIVADEPTGALDTKNSEELLTILRTLNSEENITIVMVTHDPYIASYSSKVIMIRDGFLDSSLNRGDNNQSQFYNRILMESARETLVNNSEDEAAIASYEELRIENEKLKEALKCLAVQN